MTRVLALVITLGAAACGGNRHRATPADFPKELEGLELGSTTMAEAKAKRPGGRVQPLSYDGRQIQTLRFDDGALRSLYFDDDKLFQAGLVGDGMCDWVDRTIGAHKWSDSCPGNRKTGKGPKSLYCLEAAGGTGLVVYECTREGKLVKREDGKPDVRTDEVTIRLF